jgi:hypothetical protein
MGKGLGQLLMRLWLWSQKSSAERRVVDARARFWSEVREGEREAEDRSRPSVDGPTRSLPETGAVKIRES